MSVREIQYVQINSVKSKNSEMIELKCSLTYHAELQHTESFKKRTKLVTNIQKRNQIRQAQRSKEIEIDNEEVRNE